MKNFGPHSLRATAATNALEHGADIAKVQDWLGHSDITTTRLYDKRQHRPEDSPTFKVIAMIDNAKYHHAKLYADWRQQHQGCLALDFLPPYSPELNPIERVWKRTRRNCLHNLYFPKLARVVETVEAQFARWSEPNAALASLCRL